MPQRLASSSQLGLMLSAILRYNSAVAPAAQLCRPTPILREASAVCS
ncbi:hypothetical protein PLANPX_5509 [Lacipirellula parvula]|uniref:Uncharacterized protein n=1 Tax=Lacipirellula parvula TaxID=2650471 RepID=A0A5K7XIP3_9BACT|nr:hypothetical protein PLANPX_5509 [Lacipirellula parvula]